MSTRPQHTVEASTADQSHAAPFVFILALLVSFSLYTSRNDTPAVTKYRACALVVTPTLELDNAAMVAPTHCFFAPLLLYLYIPLRSGPGPSPWYHQTLGTAPLHLFQNNWSSFWTFVSGQSISVGFRDASGALAQLPQAWLLWQLHFYLPGLVLVGLGLYALTRTQLAGACPDRALLSAATGL
ncbi:MAG: hypothetical protein R2867_04895 [Caldilineaceae bacterium]